MGGQISKERDWFFMAESPGDKRSGNTQTFHVKNVTVVVKQGDILREKVDAIVNSSNSHLNLQKGKWKHTIVAAFTCCICLSRASSYALLSCCVILSHLET